MRYLATVFSCNRTPFSNSSCPCIIEEKSAKSFKWEPYSTTSPFFCPTPGSKIRKSATFLAQHPLFMHSLRWKYIFFLHQCSSRTGAKEKGRAHPFSHRSPLIYHRMILRVLSSASRKMRWISRRIFSCSSCMQPPPHRTYVRLMSQVYHHHLVISIHFHKFLVSFLKRKLCRYGRVSST